FFFFSAYFYHLYLHSFPTRRSSDLVTRLKDGITGVSGREVKFFPKTGMAMRYVVLAVFAQIAAVSVDDRGGVVINAGHFHFVDRSEEHTSELQSRGHLVCRLLLEKK